MAAMVQVARSRAIAEEMVRGRQILDTCCKQSQGFTG